MRKLGLDIGSRSCGFAITDENEIISSALMNLKYQEGHFETVLNQIELYLKEYKIDGFIIGYPLKISGEKSQTTLMVEEYSDLIKKRFNIPILFVNEQYSTKKAHDTLILSGMTRQKRKQNKDKLAAQIILQDYLDYYKHK